MWDKGIGQFTRYIRRANGGPVVKDAQPEPEMTEEDLYGTIAPPESPLMARAAKYFRTAERALEGHPAQLLMPGSGIAQVLERKAYGEDPSAMEYGMAALDTADMTPVGKGLGFLSKMAGVLLPGKKMSDYFQRGFIGIDTKRVDPSEIEEFDPDIGQGARRGTGTFVALNPTQSNTYAPSSGGATIPVRMNTEGFADVFFEGTGWNDPNGARLFVDEKTGLEIDYSGMTTDKIARDLRKRGYPGAIFHDVVDPGPYRKGVDKIELEDYYREGDSQVVVFDPSRIVFEKQPVNKALGGGVGSLSHIARTM
jgi:hypothetical protein